MTCGQLTLSQLIRLLFSARLPFLSSSFLPRLQFLPILPSDPPQLFVPLPSPSSLPLIHAPTWRILPAPPISAASRSTEAAESEGIYLLKDVFALCGRKQQIGAARTDQRRVLFFPVPRVQSVFVCAASPRRCHLRSASLEVPQGSRWLPGVVLTRLAFGGLVLQGRRAKAAVTARPRRPLPPLFFTLASPPVCCFVSEDLFRACHTFLLLSLSFMFFLTVLLLVPSLGFPFAHTVGHFPLVCSLSSLPYFLQVDVVTWLAVGTADSPSCCGS